MSQKKKHQSNAAKQRAYRERKRNIQSQSSPRSPGSTGRVTVAHTKPDSHRVYLGTHLGVDSYAFVVCHQPACTEPCCIWAMHDYDPKFAPKGGAS